MIRTPKETAIDIAMRFDKDGQTDNAKQCALICVEEIIDTFLDIDPKKRSWEEVKQEILNMDIKEINNNSADENTNE